MVDIPKVPPNIASILDESKRVQRELDNMYAPSRELANILRGISPDVDAIKELYGIVAPDSFIGERAVVSVSPHVSELQSQLAKLQNDVREKTEALRRQSADSQSKEAEIKALREDLLQLRATQTLAHLLNRVRPSAQEKLVSDASFREQFQAAEPCAAYVVAIDIRRSTELMLKARAPRLFAEFIINLAAGLRQLTLENYGVFDKFTGDGILAFFPEFYSGADAGYRALNAAIECHELFAQHYRRSRSFFTSVLKETGLGIGVDYGPAQIVEIGGEFTVVGTPVVYACRMASADAGHTYLNQPAYDQLFQRYAAFDFEERELDIKHEGRTVAYSAKGNGKAFAPEVPAWETSTATTA